MTTQSLLPISQLESPPAHIQEKDTRLSTSRTLTSLRQIHSTGSRMVGRSRVGCPGRGLPFLNRSLAAGDRFWHRTCLQHSRDVPIQHQNQSQTHFWMGAGGGPSAAHPSRSKDFSSLLDSSHPSEKVLLLPVFYETPTHQPSNCSQHVLWFYVSNKKQLHLHKTCSFLSRLSPRGWSGVGGKLPFQ